MNEPLSIQALVRDGKVESIKAWLREARSEEEISHCLYIAADAGQLETAKLLLEHGASPNKIHPEFCGETCLHAAARQKHVKVTKLFLEYGANPDILSENDQSPLELALLERDLSTIEVLFEGGADLSLPFAPLWSQLLLRFVFEQRRDLMDKLKPYGVFENNSVFHFAAAGDFQQVKNYVRYGIRPDSVDDSGRTATKVAQDAGHMEIAKYLQSWEEERWRELHNHLGSPEREGAPGILIDGGSNASALDFEIETEEVLGNKYLTLDSQRIYFLGNLCGTCDFLFRRLTEVPENTSSKEISRALERGKSLLTPEFLGKAGLLVPPGKYCVFHISIRPSLVKPGAQNDYFYKEGAPHAAAHAYFRGQDAHLSEDTLFFHFVLPLQDIQNLDSERVSYYRERFLNGARPTVLALSIFDIRKKLSHFEDYVETELHGCLAHHLLDGHHKMLAASQAGVSCNVLSFFNLYHSSGNIETWKRLADILPPPVT